MSKIEVRKSRISGRGVFALNDIRKDELIEKVPVLVFSYSEHEDLDKTKLGDYIYDWDGKGVAVAFGCGSFYNHSYRPNAICIQQGRYLEYRALKNIAANEEIQINYNGNPRSRRKIIFG